MAHSRLGGVSQNKRLDLLLAGQRNHANQRQLEYDFVVQPEADPRAIQLGFAGATSSRIDWNGDLVLGTDGGEVIFHRPVVYQPANHEPGTRDVLEGKYVIRGDEQVTFEVARYDRTRPLVIDPTLAYSSLFQSAQENARQIAHRIGKSGGTSCTGAGPMCLDMKKGRTLLSMP